MPPPQQQVVYLPAKRDTTALGMQMLAQALQQMVQSAQDRRDRARADAVLKQAQERQAAQDALAAEDRKRRIAAEDIAKQRADESALAQLAPSRSMFEPAGPTAIPATTEVPGAEDLGLPAETTPVQLGSSRLAAPLLREITLPSGRKVPLNVNPSLEQTTAETAAADAITFPSDPNISPLFRGHTFKPGDPGFALARAVYPKLMEQLVKPASAPTTKNIGGRTMGWDPQAQDFTRDFGPAGTPQRPSAGAEPLDIQPDVQTTATGYRFLSLSDYGVKERTTVRQQAHKAGVVPLSKADVDTLQEIDAARANTADIFAQVRDKLPHDAAGRLVVGPENRLSKFFQTDSEVAAFTSWRTAAIKNLRATAGSKGLRLNQAEIALAVENDIPKLTDTFGVAQQKVKNLNTMFDNAESAIFGGRGSRGAGGGSAGSSGGSRGSSPAALADAFLKTYGQ